MSDNRLQELYVEQLRDLYSAENQLLKALPKMAKAAESDALRQAFEHQLQQSKGHADRLEQIFSRIHESPKGRKCAGMEGLIKEGEEFLSEQSDGAALDSSLIAAAQRVHHYEIAGYGTVRSFAEALGDTEAANLLQQTLDEEKQTDQQLTEIATECNAQALEAPAAGEAQTEEDEAPEETKRASSRGRKSAKARSARA